MNENSISTRRRVQRVLVDPPIMARVGAINAVLTDVSLDGAGIQHQSRLAQGEPVTLGFESDEESVHVRCEVRRTRLVSLKSSSATLSVYRTGLHFDHSDGEGLHAVRRFVNERIAIALRHQRENWAGTGSATDTDQVSLSSLFHGQAALGGALYVRCSNQGGLWHKEDTDIAEQPEFGFTVPKVEGPEAIDMLCRLFDRSDATGRNIIRTFAHLSLTEPSGESRTRYNP